MRWAYSGSMRPKFKVLACDAFRAELSALQLKSGFWSRFGIGQLAELIVRHTGN
jgi:hypothetical protein